MKRLILLMIAAFAASGCSTKYSCSEYPEAGCQPVSAVYSRTNNGYDDYRENLFDKNVDSDGKSSRTSSAPMMVGQAYRSLNYAVPGDPILTKPETMRVLVNSWVDSDGDLNAGGYLYLRLRDSEWLMQTN